LADTKDKHSTGYRVYKMSWLATRQGKWRCLWNTKMFLKGV